jgi:hypothetical protein
MSCFREARLASAARRYEHESGHAAPQTTL